MNKILITIGVIILILGIFSATFVNEEDRVFGLFETQEAPYRQYAIPLFVGAIILIVVGAIMNNGKMSA
jgi:hypothetical protein